MTDFSMDQVQAQLDSKQIWGVAKEFEEASLEDLAKMFSFTDRESYLAWVAQWKGVLKSVEATIRHHKSMRSGENGIWVQAEAQYKAYLWGQAAHALLAQRHAAKRLSAHMRSQRLAQAEQVELASAG
jgi:hypothetical protein